MPWHSIESQDDLDALDRRVCWEDSETVEYYATERNEDYFPSDVSRSGYVHKNVHILCRTCSSESKYLEMVWIHCDLFNSHFLEHLYLSGRVDNLKRVEILDDYRAIQMRCARLIYRLVAAENVTEGSYYVQDEKTSRTHAKPFDVE